MALPGTACLLAWPSEPHPGHGGPQLHGKTHVASDQVPGLQAPPWGRGEEWRGQCIAASLLPATWMLIYAETLGRLAELRWFRLNQTRMAISFPSRMRQLSPLVDIADRGAPAQPREHHGRLSVPTRGAPHTRSPDNVRPLSVPRHQL